MTPRRTRLERLQAVSLILTPTCLGVGHGLSGGGGGTAVAISHAVGHSPGLRSTTRLYGDIIRLHTSSPLLIACVILYGVCGVMDHVNLDLVSWYTHRAPRAWIQSRTRPITNDDRLEHDNPPLNTTNAAVRSTFHIHSVSFRYLSSAQSGWP